MTYKLIPYPITEPERTELIQAARLVEACFEGQEQRIPRSELDYERARRILETTEMRIRSQLGVTE
jgi:hypothetical protein